MNSKPTRTSWKPGQSGNPNGRPPRVQEKEIREALHRAIPNEEVLSVLASKIRAGESWAVTLYLAYDWGKPRVNVEISGVEGEPLFDYARVIAAITGQSPRPETDCSPSSAD